MISLRHVALVALACFGVARVSAQAIFISNAGFEEDIVVDGGYISDVTPIGWSRYDRDSILDHDYNDLGVLNPTDTGLYPGGAPQGSKVALVFLWQQNPLDYNKPAGLQQTLAATLQASTRYTLSVQVGNIAAIGSPGFDLNGFPGYRIEFLAGGTLLAQDNNTLAPAEGTFAQSIIDFTTGVSDEGLGEEITIRLINLGAPDSGIEVNFDAVQLNAVAVPEPSTYATMAGVVALGFSGWRRRARV